MELCLAQADDQRMACESATTKLELVTSTASNRRVTVADRLERNVSQSRAQNDGFDGERRRLARWVEEGRSATTRRHAEDQQIIATIVSELVNRVANIVA